MTAGITDGDDKLAKLLRRAEECIKASQNLIAESHTLQEQSDVLLQQIEELKQKPAKVIPLENDSKQIC